jgi:prephenate dehydratase
MPIESLESPRSPGTAATAHARVNRVAYQGVAGAFSEDAVRQLWNETAEPWPARTFAEALTAVASGAVDHAVIPIWNSTIGSIALAEAALGRHGDALARVREIDLPVRHCLLALPGAAIADVRFVGSHPAALGQCARAIAARGLTACEAYDTAGAARELSAYGDRQTLDREPWYASLRVESPVQLAAIASAGAAARYGLTILAHDIQDDPTNLTRFVVVARSEGARP